MSAKGINFESRAKLRRRIARKRGRVNARTTPQPPAARGGGDVGPRKVLSFRSLSRPLHSDRADRTGFRCGLGCPSARWAMLPVRVDARESADGDKQLPRI